MKKINPIIGIIWVSTILVISVVAYSLWENRRREGHLETCWKLHVTSCYIDKYSGEVEGILINTCDEKVHSLEVLSEFYSADGAVVFTGDPEYVTNLEPGERTHFKVVAYETDSHGVACNAYITEGY